MLQKIFTNRYFFALFKKEVFRGQVAILNSEDDFFAFGKKNTF
jgi:hypothetical protein